MGTDHARDAGTMRCRAIVVALLSLPMFAACAEMDDGPTPYDDDFPVGDPNINDGAPDNNTLPDDNKADAVYPKQFELGDQSPVQSQGSRGVCSIFASTALVENLYIKAGMPVAETDFSEQYLQWAVKKQLNRFPNTEGSSSDANIQTVVTYGTVKEAAWPYESFPWTAANDPECGTVPEGQSKPTKCYTNGEPPTSAITATKYKLPSMRWINTNSIKAHITSRKTGVNVGMDFFYQSWNHRRSTTPIDNDLWRKGVVTYPNAKDKEESYKQRAGHAIHIIGWDDDIEFPMRDGEGKPVLDAQGNPRKEKGFWIFKNSWGTTSFGVDHPTGPGYGYLSYKYVQEYGRAAAAETPTLQPSGPTEPTNPTGQTRTYNATPAAAIPDNSPTGVSNTINVTDTGTIGEATLTVDITHTYRGDLTVTLTKGADSIVVHNGAGGSADDLKATFPLPALANKALAGGWTLKVVDGAKYDTGKLNSWKLEIKTR
jgi:C1A family cysteine protease